jgi:hypothetical protein
VLHVGLLNGPHTNSYALFCQLENRTDGVDYAIRVKSYNPLFRMVILIPFLTQPPHERTLTGRGSRVYPNVGAAGCTLKVGAAGVP